MKTVERNRYDGEKVFETRTLTFEPFPYDEIDDVLYDDNIISLLENNFQKLSMILVFISLLFFLIAFVLINSNIS